MILEITGQNFEDEVLKSDLPVVNFWALWCGRCLMVASLIGK